MKIDRTRYIGGSVVLCSSSKFSSYRQRAVRLVVEDFRAHTEVRDHVLIFRKRRDLVYRKIMSTLYGSDILKMVGTMPIDYKTCFTVGGSADHPMDNQALEGLFDCILENLGLYPTTVFTAESAEAFRVEAGSAIRQNKMQLGLALNELEKEEHQFDLAGDEGADKLYNKLRTVIPKEKTMKDEIKTMAYSVAHAASNAVDAVYITCEDSMEEQAVLKKVGKVVGQVMGMKPDICPQVAHISQTFF